MAVRVVGQHRGKGQREGHGKAGRHKHKWSYILKYEPDYFDKRGFEPPKGKEEKVINVGDLDEKIQELVRKKGQEKARRHLC